MESSRYPAPQLSMNPWVPAPSPWVPQTPQNGVARSVSCNPFLQARTNTNPFVEEMSLIDISIADPDHELFGPPLENDFTRLNYKYLWPTVFDDE